MNHKTRRFLRKLSVIFFLTSAQSSYSWFSTSADFPAKDTEIYFITVGTGELLHMLGGHTLIRLKNLKTNRDTTFNWGVFQETDPDFFYKYLTGTLKYSCMESPTFSTFLFYKRVEQRTIWQAQLNLTEKQKQVFLDRIWWWMKPENKDYQYHLLHNTNNY